MKALTRGLLVGGLLALAGCTTVRERDLRAALEQAHVDRLQPATSEAQLAAIARASERLDALVHAKGAVELGEGVLETVTVTGSRIDAADLITNTQEAGIDEGDIVKKSGDFLLALRQGELRVVAIRRDGRETLEQTDRVRIGADITSDDAWYDELLASGPHVLVLGYSYREDCTRIHVFELDGDGRLKRGPLLKLRSDDYYSGSNYGTRLHGDDVVFVASVGLDDDDAQRWPMGSTPTAPDWRPLIDADAIRLPTAPTLEPTIHVILACPLDSLARGELACRGSGFVASSGPELYVSDQHVYLSTQEWEIDALRDPDFDPWSRWLSEAPGAGMQYTLIHRLPLDPTQAPGVARVSGVASSHFAFREVDGALFVATAEADGRNPQRSDVGLHRLSAADFSDVPRRRETRIAAFPVDSQSPVLRITGEALWAGADRWGRTTDAPAASASDVIVQPLSGASRSVVTLPHSSDRFEPIPGRMIVVGESDDAWRMSSLSRSPRPTLLSDLGVPDYRPSDTRSHAFNFRALPDGRVVFGLPAVRRTEDRPWYDDEAVADLVFFLDTPAGLRPAGALRMDDGASPEDDCEASCVDWYGNARLFFVGDRVFALSADRLKEGVLVDGRVVEVRTIAL